MRFLRLFSGCDIIMLSMTKQELQEILAQSVARSMEIEGANYEKTRRMVLKGLRSKKR